MTRPSGSWRNGAAWTWTYRAGLDSARNRASRFETARPPTWRTASGRWPSRNSGLASTRSTCGTSGARSPSPTRSGERTSGRSGHPSPAATSWRPRATPSGWSHVPAISPRTTTPRSTPLSSSKSRDRSVSTPAASCLSDRPGWSSRGRRSAVNGASCGTATVRSPSSATCPSHGSRSSSSSSDSSPSSRPGPSPSTSIRSTSRSNQPRTPFRYAAASVPSGVAASGSRNGRLRWTGPAGWRARCAAWAAVESTHRAGTAAVGTGQSNVHRATSWKTGGWRTVWLAPVSRSSGGRSAVRRRSGTPSASASTAAGSRLATAVPLVVTTAAGRPVARPHPKATNAAARSSQCTSASARGFSATATASGVLREPGHTTKKVVPCRTSSSTRSAAHRWFTFGARARCGGTAGGPYASTRSASPRTRAKSPILCSISAHSAPASEPATIPAPL